MELSAKTDAELAAKLVLLPAKTRGRLSFEDYESITGEEFDEFSTAGRLLVGNVAAETGCRLDPPHAGGVFFLKK
jgi:hypothetical protein